MIRFCPSCRQAFPSDGEFCPKCGAAIPAGQQSILRGGHGNAASKVVPGTTNAPSSTSPRVSSPAEKAAARSTIHGPAAAPISMGPGVRIGVLPPEELPTIPEEMPTIPENPLVAEDDDVTQMEVERIRVPPAQPLYMNSPGRRSAPQAAQPDNQPVPGRDSEFAPEASRSGADMVPLPPVLAAQSPSAPPVAAAVIAGADDPTKPASSSRPRRATTPVPQHLANAPLMPAHAYAHSQGMPMPPVHRGHAKIPLTPHPLRIALGFVLLIAGLYLAMGFLPQRAPISDADARALAAQASSSGAKIENARLSHEVYSVVLVAAIVAIAFGVGLTITGLFFRNEVAVVCRSCRRSVYAWRRTFGLKCPACFRFARINWVSVIAAVFFWLTVLTLGIALVVLVAT